MYNKLKRSAAMLCSLVILASSLPVGALNSAGSLDSAGKAEDISLGGPELLENGDCTPIDEDVLREHTVVVGEDTEADAGINVVTTPPPSSCDLSTSEYFPTLITPSAPISTAAACVYYQFTYTANRYNDIASNKSTTVYSPNWAERALRIRGNSTSSASADMFYDFLKEHGALHYSDDSSTSNGAMPTDEAKLREAMKTRLNTWNAHTIPSTGITRTNTSLIYIKSLISTGNLPRVEIPYYSVTRNTSSYGDVVVMTLTKGGLKDYSGVVVGYNDNITCDINEDGVISACERGAFKVLGGINGNSRGYTWIMYDALNYQSSISGDWEDEYTTLYRAPRQPAFHNFNTSSGNYFYTINVREYDTEVIARVSFKNAVQYMPRVNLYRCTDDPDDEIEYDTTQNTVYGTSYQQNFFLLFDLSLVGLSFSNIGTSGYTYEVLTNTASGTVDNVRFIDDLGDTVVTPTKSGDVYSAELCFPIGDLNYSGTVTTQDLVRLQNYLDGNRELSSLQLDRADADRDGNVDTDDLQKIMQIMAASK